MSDDLLCHGVIVEHPDGTTTRLGVLALTNIDKAVADAISAWRDRKKYDREYRSFVDKLKGHP